MNTRYSSLIKFYVGVTGIDYCASACYFMSGWAGPVKSPIKISAKRKVKSLEPRAAKREVIRDNVIAFPSLEGRLAAAA